MKTADGCMCSHSGGKLRQVRDAPASAPGTAHFLAALYIHAVMVVTFAVFSRNPLSAVLRPVVLPLIR